MSVKKVRQENLVLQEHQELQVDPVPMV